MSVDRSAKPPTSPKEAHQGGVREETVPIQRAGQRVDNFLLARLKGVPKSRVYQMLRRGEVRINGRRVRPSARLQANDLIRLPPVRLKERGSVTPGRTLLAALSAAIVFEDERLLVLNKPAGVPVHGGTGVAVGIIEALRVLRPSATEAALAHRLDRNTSGCLLVVKDRALLSVVHKAMRGADKRYLAVVRGTWPRHVQKVDLALDTEARSGGERTVRVAEAGRHAVTHFRVIEALKGATLVEARLETGRTHQVRAHAAAAGCPVAGDARYGDASFNRGLRGLGLRRMFLHASHLAMALPGDKPYCWQAPLPAELENILARLR